MGENVTRVQKVFSERYNLGENELKTNGSQFDKLVSEGMEWTLGKDIRCSVLATPGHTPACMSYRIGDAAFVGDTLFMVILNDDNSKTHLTQIKAFYIIA